jgi:hypothetical protein
MHSPVSLIGLARKREAWIRRRKQVHSPTKQWMSSMERFSVRARGDYSPSRPEANLPKRSAAYLHHGPEEIKPSTRQSCRVSSSSTGLGYVKGNLWESDTDPQGEFQGCRRV